MKKWIFLLHLLIVNCLLFGCATLPDHTKSASYALSISESTKIGQKIAPALAVHSSGQSGILPLERGLDAFLARLVLADAAERSLDVQYYIWHDDTTGRILAARLLQAADRGVRVRLLLDDFGSVKNDIGLLTFALHPNIEVRLFNPFAGRRIRWIEFITDFGRVSRRMHNKSFTADNQITIVGGRNIGDEYFEAQKEIDFGDFDVLAIGSVVQETSGSFDKYWNSPYAFPISKLNDAQLPPDSLVQAGSVLDAYVDNLKHSRYIEALRRSSLAGQLASGNLTFFWGQAWVVYDQPEKIAQDPDDRSTHLAPQIGPLFAGAKKEIIIVSPYFIPGEEGVTLFSRLRERGLRVIIFTNSLASTDVAAVHAGYARYREDLLRAGVELYEVKPSGENRRKRTGSGGLTESSRASLHAKTFIIDRRMIFVGSLNLDPRSVLLNTEMGLLLDCPDLAVLMAQGIEKALPEDAYRLRLKATQKSADANPPGIEWVAREGGGEVSLTTEPATSAWRRLGAWFFSLLPIESQL